MQIVLEDHRVVVVDKPAGLTSEDAARALGHKLVHRIDKETSGLLVLAHDARAVQMLQRALRDGDVEREYLLVAHGVVESGRIESELVRDRGDGLRGSGAPGKPSMTDVELVAVDEASRFSLARARLHTGRTHQIRIHLAERGHPLVGERVYVRDARAAGVVLVDGTRLMLHARRLAFVHPVTKARVEVVREPPAEFLETAARLGLRVR